VFPDPPIIEFSDEKPALFGLMKLSYPFKIVDTDGPALMKFPRPLPIK